MKYCPWVAGLIVSGIIVGAVVVRSKEIPGVRSISVPREEALRGERPFLLPQSPPVRRESPVVSFPVPSKEVESQPLRLRDWLLQLPDVEFALLIHTATLDRYVASILRELGRERSPGEVAPREVGEFLRQLNGRILSLQPERNGR